MKSFQGFACVFVCLVSVDHDCCVFGTVITTLSTVYILVSVIVYSTVCISLALGSIE